MKAVVKHSQQAYCLALVKVTRTRGRQEQVALYSLLPVTWLVWWLMQHQEAVRRIAEKAISTGETVVEVARVIRLLAGFIEAYLNIWYLCALIVAVALIWALTPRGLR